ncbi:hypothetical protein WJX84_003112 [Apatococcus fuscideae]|uniref:ubiquitinyl hydrolase 1 n=1 Tax=Apatococcus fuscideae TaxID=2026836 RepID=A0AAW1SVG4_9CHLO
MMNCGNSCYAASVLQCLLQTSGITEYLARSFHSQRCTAPEHKWCLLCELQRLLNCPAVHTYQPPSFLRLNRSFSPSRACSVKPFIEHIEEIGPDFSSGQQEDAHEFFVQLLDRIESIMLAEAGGRRHFNHRSQETTLVNHAFSGYIRNQTMCRSCGHASKVFESCMSLPLELPEGIHSLEDALAAYMRQESLDGDNQYRCDRCDKNVDAVRSCRFEVLPNTLQICLKRFQVGFFGKIRQAHFLSGHTQSCAFQSFWHYSYGHYICFIRSADNNWYKCDDDEVQRVDDSEVAIVPPTCSSNQRAVPKPSPHELAHAASLQPIPAPVPLLRDVQAGNELGTKLKTAENHHYGKENISAAANARFSGSEVPAKEKQTDRPSLTIPARPQPSVPYAQLGQHAAQQDMNAAESESLEHFLRDASPPPSSADLETVHRCMASAL